MKILANIISNTKLIIFLLGILFSKLTYEIIQQAIKMLHFLHALQVVGSGHLLRLSRKFKGKKNYEIV